MSKVLQTAALVVGAAALVATGIGAIGGASLFVAASTATYATLGVSLSAFATIATVGAAGLALVGGLTAAKPGTGGSATTFRADPNSGVPYVVGRTANAGNIVYRRTYNSPGYSLPDLQAFVVILSGAGPIDGIESFQSDKPTQVYDSSGALVATTDTRVSFDATGAASGGFNSWMWQTTQLGACPEAGVLAKTYGGTLPPDWTAASKLSGMAAAMWTLRYDQKGKVFVNGVPAPTWVVRGVKVYDPRLDATYPGGAGSCRALDETTYVYSENPYLHALTFALGRFQNGAKVFGVGLPVAGIDVPTFVEGANVADANGWQAGGLVYSTDDKWSVLKKMLQAGGGEPMHLGAQLSCFVNTPRVVLDTVTAADVVGDVAVQATQSRRERINAILPTYRSEAHLWEMIAALTAVSVPAYATVDGGLRQKPVTYEMVQDVDQAAALARYDIENAREFGPVTLPLKLRWMGYKPGDCIAATLSECGLEAQPLVIRTRNLNPVSGAVTLTCRSETTAKHAFALGQTGTAPPTPHITGPVILSAPTGWAITATSLANATSTTPALVVAGSAAGVVCDGIVFEYRPYVSGAPADAGWLAAGTQPASATGTEITALLPDTDYQAAVSYRLGNQVGPRQIIGPETTDIASASATTSVLISTSYTQGLGGITLTVAGGAVTATIPAHARVYADRTVAVGSASVTGLSFSTTYSFYYDDASRTGGAVTAVATTVAADAFVSAAHPARHYLGYATTPDAGGTGGSGAGGSPPPGHGGGGGGPIP